MRYPSPLSARRSVTSAPPPDSGAGVRIRRHSDGSRRASGRPRTPSRGTPPPFPAASGLRAVSACRTGSRSRVFSRWGSFPWEPPGGSPAEHRRTPDAAGRRGDLPNLARRRPSRPGNVSADEVRLSTWDLLLGTGGRLPCPSPVPVARGPRVSRSGVGVLHPLVIPRSPQVLSSLRIRRGTWLDGVTTSFPISSITGFGSRCRCWRLTRMCMNRQGHRRSPFVGEVSLQNRSNVGGQRNPTESCPRLGRAMDPIGDLERPVGKFRAGMRCGHTCYVTDRGK